MDEQTQGQSEAPAVETEVVAEGAIAPIEAAAEQVTEEVKPEPVAPAEDARLAQKFAALSRKEKQIRDRERQIQQQMTQFQQQMEQFKAQQSEVEKYKSLPERLRKNPGEVLKESGITAEQLTEMLLNGGKPTEAMERSELETKVLARVEELQKRLEAKEAAEQEQKLEAQISQFKGQLSDFVTETADYELIRANNGTELVYEVIERHYSQTLEETGEGEILSNKDACDLVENYYLEEAKKLVDREKVKKLFAPQPPPKPAVTGKPSPTLSNTQASRVPNPGKQTLSKDESMAQAAQLIRWED